MDDIGIGTDRVLDDRWNESHTQFFHRLHQLLDGQGGNTHHRSAQASRPQTEACLSRAGCRPCGHSVF